MLNKWRFYVRRIVIEIGGSFAQLTSVVFECALETVLIFSIRLHTTSQTYTCLFFCLITEKSVTTTEKLIGHKMFFVPLYKVFGKYFQFDK